MRYTTVAKRMSVIALLLLAVMVPHSQAEVPRNNSYPLGVFNFDFGRLGTDETAQIGTLKSIGYGGLVMNLSDKNQLATLHRYQAAIGSEPFQVYAGYVVVYFEKDGNAEGQCTVVTETRGPFKGKRVVRGHEPQTSLTELDTKN